MFGTSKVVNYTQQNSRVILSINLINYRKEAHISREKFAELCDLSQRHVTNMEKCKVSITLDTLDKIAEGTKLPITYWLALHIK
ncbi:MAG: helix-turn-helix transcriptional regulator [Clostridia bacterium]|nr:helix-turn-helix transcriptional regulator [Clostridia bacterium]MBQ8862210.1 helix-turn-helix transcriptional regulator [Clostridia bacterium]